MTATARRDTKRTQWIDDLIARQRRGLRARPSLLPRPGNLFEHDVERLLMRHWLCAGHASLIPNPGDYFLFELATESAIVIRGEDGELRAFANVCRHRGSRICAEPSGHAKFFVCPYHAWSYGLDGSLRAARHMPEGFDTAAHGLKPIHTRVIQGLIFVTFAARPLGLANLEATVNGNCFGPYGWAQARIAHPRDLQDARRTGSSPSRIISNAIIAAPRIRNIRSFTPSSSRWRGSRSSMQGWRRSRASLGLGTSRSTNHHWAASRSGEEAAFGVPLRAL